MTPPCRFKGDSVHKNFTFERSGKPAAILLVCPLKGPPDTVAP